MHNEYDIDLIQKYTWNSPDEMFSRLELETILVWLKRMIALLQSDFDGLFNIDWDMRERKKQIFDRVDLISDIIWMIEERRDSWFYIDKLATIKESLWEVIYRDNNHELDKIFERVSEELKYSIDFIQGIN